MTSSLLSSRHMFTTRLGGVSEGVYESWNLGENRGDDLACVRENFRRAGALMGTDADGFVITKQVHGTEVRIASDADRHTVGEAVPYAADGLVTARSGLALMVFIADCVPVLLEDAQAGVIAAVHCGWRRGRYSGRCGPKDVRSGRRAFTHMCGDRREHRSLLLRDGRRRAGGGRKLPLRRHGGAYLPSARRKVQGRSSGSQPPPTPVAGAAPRKHRRVRRMHDVQSAKILVAPRDERRSWDAGCDDNSPVRNRYEKDKKIHGAALPCRNAAPALRLRRCGYFRRLR